MQGTGANFLASAVYFTFLFSLPLLLATTAHFVLGAAVEKVGAVGCYVLCLVWFDSLFGLLQHYIMLSRLCVRRWSGQDSRISSPSSTLNTFR